MDYVLQHKGSVFAEYAVIVIDYMYCSQSTVGDGLTFSLSVTDEGRDATKFLSINDAFWILSQVVEEGIFDNWDVLPYVEEK
uniref:Uncharacterized protein n=1 Tax=Vibrio phage P018-4 TaxID=3229728 RepID=A0AB39AJH8_9CAUD